MTSGPVQDAPAQRIDSIDILRGVVMVLMAIDHVRVFAGVPAGGPEPGVFLTRWVTHFVAPAFAFFAGTGAFLHGRKLGDPRALAKYLMTRGALLVLLELTVLRAAWTFNFDYAHYVLAGVIWMLGWCMMLLALLVRWPLRRIAWFALIVVVFQSILWPIAGAVPESLQSSVGVIFQYLYTGGWVAIGDGGIGVLYSIVPWIGVMAGGYAFGAVLTWEPDARRRWCLRYGLGATALFLVAGGILAAAQGGGGSGEAGGEGSIPFWMRLLNQQKYPASQLFLLMTLGPTVAMVPAAERAGRRVALWFRTFGRVPMFYYLLHIPLIHVAALIVSRVREGTVNPWLFGNHPYAPPDVPPGYRWSLGLLYLVFLICVVVLYFPCRWYAALRATKRYRWLSYL